MEIIAYSDEFKKGVVRVLKENYSSFNAFTEEKLSCFIDDITNYEWIDSVKDVPFKRGLVLVDNKEVKGFFGLIYSRHFINGKEQLYVNPTTWAIDKNYRIYMFTVMQKVNESADTVVDLTSTEQVEKICVKMFKYSIYDNFVYKYFILPSFCKRLCLKPISSEDEFVQEDIKKAFLDHKKYNVKCVEIKKNNDCCYVFYYVKKRKIKRLFNTRWVYILFVSNINFFCNNTKSIFQGFLFKEGANFFAIDSRYIKKEKFNKKPNKKEDRSRIVLNRKNFEFKDWGHLYSEIVTLLRY